MGLVLVTGATGEVARGVLPTLEKNFELRLLSLDPPGGDPRHVRADLLDWAALARAMAGAEQVLHLAVAPGHSGVWEDDAFNDQRFDVNVKGTFHVFETARRLGVRRVVQVSSVMVTWGRGMAALRSGGGPVPGDAEPRPVGTYALTKALGEQVARHYAEAHGLEVVILRITAPLDVSDPGLRGKAVRPQQVPVPDLAQAFAKALTVPLPGGRCHCVTVAGDSSKCLWDLGPARRLLGYEPRHRLDDLGVTFAEPFDVREPPGR
ncbi:MAG TPA: NAD-dependent epimerase/dehydratase family protein [Gemmataceae bacterium]|nr:NAD-dependent epimerase/dehydratase family protein [Gemmataceae bacterium]